MSVRSSLEIKEKEKKTFKTRPYRRAVGKNIMQMVTTKW